MSGLTPAEAAGRGCPVIPQPACGATECMAWRWQPLVCEPEWISAVRKQATATDDKAPFAKSARYVNENRAEFGLPDQPFRGYCGLAGKPEA